jgi:hypothetical protein
MAPVLQRRHLESRHRHRLHGLVLAGPDLETAVLIALISGLVLYTAGLLTDANVIVIGQLGWGKSSLSKSYPFRR